MRAFKMMGALALMPVLAASIPVAGAQQPNAKPEKVEVEGKPVNAATPGPTPADSITENTVTVGSEKIAYKAIAGTITVGSTDAYDSQLGLDGKLLPDGTNPPDATKPEDAPATARIFYTAYFKKDAAPGTRPVMFFYNGGPGSATMWLHMGSFGPRRVVTPDTEHKTAAPYTMVDNQYSLLDVTDVVFIDAPGTGFSRIMGKDKEKAFWGTDPDAHAFERFIRRFLTKYDRWNSPKYLFGESYGTPRSAVLSAALQNVDLNGIVLLSAILSFDNSPDLPRWNPGVDQAYALALPTYAATAFYHHKLPTQPAALEPFLSEVESFALGEYEAALLQGSQLSPAQKQAVAEKLHNYTGLPVDYLLKSDLRVTGGAFTKNLQDSDGMTTGRLDTRFKGPDLDRLSEEAEYDPQSNAISSAYTTAINQYMRTELKFGRDMTYKPGAYTEPGFSWDLRHQAPGGPPVGQGEGGTNVMPDLAYTMKTNPNMHVMLAGGYFDLATPFFEGIYEMHHLQIPAKLQSNISYKYYQSGHMVYVNENVLKQFHDDVASFVRSTESGK
ncbi:peptidase S10 [Granulicella sp. WH15]|uniref:S10 family peptidase n=1 Tax=Granulicella sp. WH15 TaxID=2602070 RepID=UPI0013675138|nr:peptidase S10 [Granulicella sp. WH15]QHN04498.1 peptidase S10 [Granulicella sp. WH15]